MYWNGGYVMFDEELFNNIIGNSDLSGKYSYPNCYDIVYEALRTGKPLFACAYNMSIPAFIGKIGGKIYVTLFGKSTMKLIFDSSDKNNYNLEVV